MASRSVPPAVDLILVEAPAGFGKSRLLSQWLTALKARRSRFVSRVLKGDGSDERWLTELLSERATTDSPDAKSVAVIDHWERSSEELRRTLDVALGAEPRHRWIISSREQVVIPDYALRDLHIRYYHTTDIVNALGLHGPSETIWPVMARFERPKGARENWPSAGMRRYVSAEVLSVLRPPELELLITLSPLDAIPVSELDAYGQGARHVNERLLEIAERTFLLTPIRDGNASTVFCLRRQVRDCLRYELSLRGKHEIQAIKRLAAQVHRRRGNSLEAMELAAEAETWDLVAEMLQETGIAPLMLESCDRYAAIISRLPEALIIAYPRLELFCIEVASRQGRINEATRRYKELAQRTSHFWNCPAGQSLARLRMDAQVVDFTLAHWSGRMLPKDTMSAFASFLTTAPIPTIDLALGYLLLASCWSRQGAISDAVRSLDAVKFQLGSSCSIELGFGIKLFEALIAVERCSPEEARRKLTDAANLLEGEVEKIRDGHLWLQAAASILDYETANHTNLTGVLESIRQQEETTELSLQLRWQICHVVTQFTFTQHGLQAALKYTERLHAIGASTRLSTLCDLSSALQIRVLLRAGMNNEALTLALRVAIQRQFEDATYQGDFLLLHYVQVALAAMESALAAHKSSEFLATAKIAITRMRLTGCTLSASKLSLLFAVGLFRGESFAAAGDAVKESLGDLLPAGCYQALHECGYVLEELFIAGIRMPIQFGFNDVWIGQLRAVIALIKSERQTPWLTDRELRIMRKIASGRSNKEVARLENVSENTVKYHLKNINRKLGVSDRRAASAAASARGLITRDR